ncbi:hypothetical protein GWN42_13465 [candidate division KSB1 bacterium]|nr:hypothetical protein [candidate division KSB1 bacterium]
MKIMPAKKGKIVERFPLGKGMAWSQKKAPEDGIVIALNSHEMINMGVFIPLKELEKVLKKFYEFK